jgi:hypothetical protein
MLGIEPESEVRVRIKGNIENSTYFMMGITIATLLVSANCRRAIPPTETARKAPTFSTDASPGNPSGKMIDAAVVRSAEMTKDGSVSANGDAVARASSSLIRGRLISAETKKPVVREEVWALEAKKANDGRMRFTAVFRSPRATTDSDGQFAISGVPPGTFALNVGMMGNLLTTGDEERTLLVINDGSGRLFDLGEIQVKHAAAVVPTIHGGDKLRRRK